jgi:hypothetical protein
LVFRDNRLPKYYEKCPRNKTRIDVEGNKLTSTLSERLVYANVTRRDEYLPGIIDAIKSDVSPVDAIAQIEE